MSHSQSSSLKEFVCEIQKVEGEYDINRLALAVAYAETANCTEGIATWSNNCHGILTREHTVISYATTDESFAAFRSLWERRYGGMPTFALAKKYVGWDEGACRWLKNVNYYY